MRRVPSGSSSCSALAVAVGSRLGTLAVRLRLTGRAREGRREQGVLEDGTAELDPGRLPDPGLRIPRDRRPAARNGAGRLRRHAIGSSCSRPAIGWLMRRARTARSADGTAAAPEPVELRWHGLCNHSLVVGLVGIRQPGASARPRAKISGSRSDPRRRLHAAAALADLRGVRGAFARRDRCAADVPAVDIWRRARTRPAARPVRRRLPARSSARAEPRTTSGRSGVSGGTARRSPRYRRRRRSAPSAPCCWVRQRRSPSVLHGLEAMKVPRLLVAIAAFMYRYLFVIVDEALRMRSRSPRVATGRSTCSTRPPSAGSSGPLPAKLRARRTGVSRDGSRGYRGSMP